NGRGEFVAKHLRALGPLPPPDVTPPAAQMPGKASAGDVLTRAVRADIARMLAYDPLMRLREPLPDGDTAVHQMRVGRRRLLTDRAAQPARELLPRIVAKPWRELAFGSDGISGAGHLDPLAPDEEWHEVRIRAKRARYATEAVAAVLDGPAVELAKAIADVQGQIGEHQDAAVAAQTWLSIAHADPDDHALAVTAGRLYEREREAVRRARAGFPAVWARTDRHRLTGWLP